ncbi:phosphoribosyltransferase family protein [Anaerofustis sp.]|uniref:ComF family protein n=1 Tax=Anaerofustis sp. TaxID=1872517 RepID=UPI0025B8BE95|nr:phosphoribosyltransferase family protein [Anaerofustis sp.]
MNLQNIIKETLEKIFFPTAPKCGICNKVLLTKEDIYCNECKNKVEWIKGKRCDICSRDISDNLYSNLCENCEGNEYYFTQGYSIWNYDKYSKRIIKKIKYSNCEGLAIEAGNVLYKNTRDVEFLQDIDIVIPTPSDKKRFEIRGYNQALLIAKGFAANTKIPLKENIIIKERSTKDQIGLSEKERKTNLHEAFKVTDSEIIKNKTLLIVDDVFTTGSTINEISRTLLKAGAKETYFLTLASKKNII